ncbi:MAG: hypothetical protein M0P94_03715 [Candidatus Absconditabacterales bacterium]|nr:hypothetical protein [Candidatus Absconditabacterales bacterium]
MIIKDLKLLKNIIDQLKIDKKKVGFTNGCFDILHPGHIECLDLCKEICRKYSRSRSL